MFQNFLANSHWNSCNARPMTNLKYLCCFAHFEKLFRFEVRWMCSAKIKHIAVNVIEREGCFVGLIKILLNAIIASFCVL